MTQQFERASIGGSTPEQYQRYFVPAIGLPLATDLVRLARLRPGDRVLDVACGTGVVARLALQQVGAAGKVVGLDLNPGMLAVARASKKPGTAMEWHHASADSMPLPDHAFDTVFCQLSLQLMADKGAALREMRRVLAPGGRLLLNMPGPAGPVFASMAAAMQKHISAEAAGFVHQVFSLNDTTELERLVSEAGFREVTVDAGTTVLRLPPPGEFLWQYVHSTPLAGLVAQADEPRREALEREVGDAWRTFEQDGGMTLRQRILVVIARG